MKTASKLYKYIEAHFPIVYLNTFEEDKADTLIKNIHYDREVYEWNGRDGYINFITREPVLSLGKCSFEDMLEAISDPAMLDNNIIVLKDVVCYLNNPETCARLKRIVNEIVSGADSTIIIISSSLVLPEELEKYITILEIDYLTNKDIGNVITNFLKDLGVPPIEDALLGEFIDAFKGLSEYEINRLLSLSVASAGGLSRDSLRLVFEEKQQMIKKAGILEMIQNKESMEDIGGLEELKKWLDRKATIYSNLNRARQFGVDIPKGVLIAGVPGCGKSLTAKAAASLFDVPLLRMDLGRLMGKYVGESESNLRKAISLAEAISPCVLWIDELEKGFAGVGGSGGSSDITTRLFGTFLTWMQEKESPTFIVATANDITKIPAEFLRKGRFDETFYVGLPKADERKKIFRIHLLKRNREHDIGTINFDKLSEATEGYSGSDIEGVVKDAVELCFVEGKMAVSQADLMNTIKNTSSIKEIMGKSLEDLNNIYQERKFKNASR